MLFMQEEFILHGDVKPRNIFLVPAGHACGSQVGLCLIVGLLFSMFKHHFASLARQPRLVAQLGDFGLARECPHKEILMRFPGSPWPKFETRSPICI